MDGKRPFSTKEQSEIRQVARIIFDGGAVVDNELLPFYEKWIFFINIFLQIINPKHGYFVHFPFDTDIINQPFRTMQIMEFLRSLWIEKLKADATK